MKNHVAEQPIAYILESARNALLTRDFHHAEELLHHIMDKKKAISVAEKNAAERLLARVYVRANNLEKALKSCITLAKKYPDDIEILNTLGVLYRQLNRFEESLQVLQKAKEQNPDNECVIYNLGQTYQEMKEYKKAADCFSAAIKIRPDDVSAYHYLGKLYVQLDQNEKAAAVYKKGLQYDSNDPQLNFSLAEVLQIEKQYEEAITYYQAALRNSPSWTEALQSIASLYQLMDRLDDSLKTYKTLLRITGKTAPVYTEIGILYERKHLENEAEYYYREALGIDSGYAPAALALGMLSRKKNKIEGILPILLHAEADERNKEHDLLRIHTIEACIHEKEYPKAKELLKRIATLPTDDLTVLKLKGKLAALMGETEKAEKIFEQIIAAAPTVVEFRKELAQQYLSTGKYPEAKRQLYLFLRQKPNDIEARLSLGRTEELLNNPKNAYAIYQKMLEDFPGNLDARAALSQLLQRYGNTLEALQVANEMLTLQSSSETLNDIESLADTLDLYEKAAESYIADPRLTKNLEKLKGQKIESYDPSKELSKNNYQDRVFPLFEENQVVQNEQQSEPFDFAIDAVADAEILDDYEDPLDTIHLNTAIEESPTEFMKVLPMDSGSGISEALSDTFGLPQGSQLPGKPIGGQYEKDSIPLSESAYLPGVTGSEKIGTAFTDTHEIALPQPYDDALQPQFAPSVQPPVQHTAGNMPVHVVERPVYHSRGLDTAVQSLNSIVSHLNESVETIRAPELAEALAEQIADNLLNKVHVLPQKDGQEDTTDELLLRSGPEPLIDESSTVNPLSEIRDPLPVPETSDPAEPMEEISFAAADQEQTEDEAAAAEPESPPEPLADVTDRESEYEDTAPEFAVGETDEACPTLEADPEADENSNTDYAEYPMEEAYAEADEETETGGEHDLIIEPLPVFDDEEDTADELLLRSEPEPLMDEGSAVNPPSETTDPLPLPEDSTVKESTTAEEAPFAAAEQEQAAAVAVVEPEQAEDEAAAVAEPESPAERLPDETIPDVTDRESDDEDTVPEFAAGETGEAFLTLEAEQSLPASKAEKSSGTDYPDYLMDESYAEADEETGSDCTADNVQWCRTPHTLKKPAALDTYLDTVETEVLAGMLLYLRELFSFLPEQQRDSFLNSRQRIQIQYLISRLSGELGLKDRASLIVSQKPDTDPLPAHPNPEQLIPLFRYLKTLAHDIPDEGLETSCSNLLDEILNDLSESYQQ